MTTRSAAPPLERAGEAAFRIAGLEKAYGEGSTADQWALFVNENGRARLRRLVGKAS